ncbi:MAG: hypothetical protein AB2693_24690 [Candidatus Thiodiazotropha sp.]
MNPRKNSVTPRLTSGRGKEREFYLQGPCRSTTLSRAPSWALSYRPVP